MNRRRIGFDRVIRLAWLDQGALLAHELRDAEARRAALVDHLASEVSGEKARRNTVTVLTRIWWRVPEARIPMRDEALPQVVHLAPEDRVALHWGMALLAYPLFRDVATIIGRLLGLQGDFKLAQLSRRIGAEWGNRTTLEYAVPRILRSLADWGVLQATDEVGVYRASPQACAEAYHVAARASGLHSRDRRRSIAPSDPELALWLLEAALRTRCTAAVPVTDLLRAPELFPFTIPLSSADLQRSERFQFHQQGQDILMIQVRER